MKLKIAAGLLAIGTVLVAQSPASARSASRHRHHPAAHHHRYGAAARHHAGGGHAGALAGVASWYGPGFQGRRTASGERFNTEMLTAAHRSLPLGCRVLVTNRVNGRSVVVRINDRGPFGHGKVIDLSRASARAIGMGGSAPVSLSRL